jgi:hypothetical protein
MPYVLAPKSSANCSLTTGEYNEIQKAEQRKPVPFLIYVSETVAFTKELIAQRGG